jgi:hypothetical protein
MRIETARGCAWRAFYIYTTSVRIPMPGKRWVNKHTGKRMTTNKICHFSVDPRDGVAPVLSGSFIGWDFRVPLPTVSWIWASRGGVLRHALYRAVHAFWAKMDGRYGWGAPKRS